MVRSFLPPGFRFHPTDVELVMYFLKRKIMGRSFPVTAISGIDLYEFDPWDLPGKSCLQSNDLEWYFFCSRARKYATGSKANRATINGFWKATGDDKSVCYNSKTVGWRKTLVFHKGKAPRGDRTDWVMHEYRLDIKDLVGAGISQDAYVVCKIFEKSGRGPRNGEQYGAPFKEEDYEDEVEGNPFLPFFLAHSSTSSAVPAEDQNISMITGTTDPKEACGLSLDPLPNPISVVPAEDQNISMITNTTDPKEVCGLPLDPLPNPSSFIPAEDQTISMITSTTNPNEACEFESVSQHNMNSYTSEEYFDIDELLMDCSNHDAAAAAAALVLDGNGKDEGLDSCILPKSPIKDAAGLDGCGDIYKGLENIIPQAALEVDHGFFLELNDLRRIMETDGFGYNMSSDPSPFNGNNGSLVHDHPVPLDIKLPACGENWSCSIPLLDGSGISGDKLAAVSEIDNFGGNSSWHCQAVVDSPRHSRKRRKQ